MKPYAQLLSILAVLAPAALVQGQTLAANNVDTVRIGGGDNVASDMTIFLNVSQCEANENVVFTMDNLGNASAQNPVLEVWSDEAQDCGAAAGRTFTNGTSPCTLLGTTNNPPGEVTVTIPVRNIINQVFVEGGIIGGTTAEPEPEEEPEPEPEVDAGMDEGMDPEVDAGMDMETDAGVGDMDDGDMAADAGEEDGTDEDTDDTDDTDSSELGCSGSGSVTVHFLLLNTPTPDENMSSSIPLSVAPLATNVTFQLTTTRPAAPTGVTAGDGDTQVTVSWSSEADPTTTGFELYIDSTGCGEDSVLEAGGALPEVGGTISRISVESGMSQDVDPRTLGLGVSEGNNEAAVAVVTVEEGSDNRSVLSELACIVREPTESAFDKYEDEFGEVATCSARAGSAGTPWLGLPLLGLVGFFIIRIRGGRRA